jgi:heterodisulfide reductase subunit C
MLIFAYLKEILLGIVGFFALYLFNRNKTLKAEKEVLEQNITTKDRVIDVQNKVMEVRNTIEHTDLDTTLNSLSKSKKK